MTTLNFYNNNPWQNLLNQGLCMLGGNSSAFGVGTFGFGSLGNVSDSYFNQMAAYSVVNSVFSTINQAVSSNQSTRENKNVTYENNKNQIQNIDKQIADLNAEKANPKVDAKYDTDIKAAESAHETLVQSQSSLKAEVNSLDTKINAETDKTNKEELQKQKAKKEAKLKELEDQIKTAKAKVDDANQAKTDAIEAKKAEIDEKIKALEAQKAELQADVDNYELDKADGKKLQRTSKDKYNAYLNNNGYVNENGSYTKRDLRTAVNRFMNGLSNSTDKYKAAKNVITIYNRLSSEDKTAILKQAAEIANKYVKEHNEDGSEK